MGNAGDSIDDLVDFARTIAQHLYFAGGSMHVLVDAAHTLNCLHDRFSSNLGILTGYASHIIENLGAFGYLTAGAGHLLYFHNGPGNLIDLLIAGLHQLGHAIKNSRGRIPNLVGHHFHTHNQAAQLIHHIVKGVCQHAQSVGGHFCLYAQVPFTNATDLADQLLYLRLQTIALRLRFLDEAHDIIQHIIHGSGHNIDFIASTDERTRVCFSFGDALRQCRQLDQRMRNGAPYNITNNTDDDNDAQEDDNSRCDHGVHLRGTSLRYSVADVVRGLRDLCPLAFQGDILLPCLVQKGSNLSFGSIKGNTLQYLILCIFIGRPELVQHHRDRLLLLVG